MFISNNEKYARRAKGFANKGSEYDAGLRKSLRPTSEDSGSSRGFAFLGDFHRMSPLQAAVGLAQLGRLDETLSRRARVAEIVDDIIYELPGITRPNYREGDRVSYYTYVFKAEERVLGVTPALFNDALTAEGVDSGQGALAGQPLYRFPVFAEEKTYGNSHYPFVDEQGTRRIDYNALTLPVAERELPKIVSFISNSRHTEKYAVDIGNAIRKVALNYANRK